MPPHNQAHRSRPPRRAALLLALLALARPAAPFSTFAGSCKHAGVNHGLDKFAAQE